MLHLAEVEMLHKLLLQVDQVNIRLVRHGSYTSGSE